MTIEPRVILQFQRGKGIQVNGQLIARGTPNQPITFTAQDIEGPWSGILFSAANATSYLQYCKIQFAGQTGNTRTAAISVVKSNVLIDDSVIMDRYPSSLVRCRLTNYCKY